MDSGMLENWVRRCEIMVRVREYPFVGGRPVHNPLMVIKDATT